MRSKVLFYGLQFQLQLQLHFIPKRHAPPGPHHVLPVLPSFCQVEQQVPESMVAQVIVSWSLAR